MEVSQNEKQLRNHYFGDENHVAKKKKVLVKRPVGGGLGNVIVVNGKPMVKTGLTKNTRGAVPSNKPIMKAGAAATGAVLKKAKKKKKKGIFRKVAAGVKKGAKGVAKGVKKAIKKVTVAASLAPLLPLKGVMKKALRKKGFPVPKKMEDLAESFYNNIVRKSSNYDGSFGTGELRMNGYDDEHVIGDIVKAVLEFVRDLIKKRKAKKKGQNVPMTETEEIIAAESEQVVKAIEKKAEEAGISTAPELPTSSSKDAPETAGDTEVTEALKEDNTKTASAAFGKIPTPVLIGAGALLLLAFFKK